MKITFRVPAYVIDFDSGELVPTPDAIHGWKYSDDQLDRYLDFELADAGISGGKIRATVTAGRAELLIDYWAPADLPASLLEGLRKDTVAQMEDGIGEGGFDVGLHDGAKLLLMPDPDPGTTISVETTNDGLPVPEPSRIAISARKGDLATLRAELAAGTGLVDALHQGYTGLEYAILYGHLEAALILLDAGADPNRADSDGKTPLICCALSNRLDDAASCELAKRLFQRGAITNHVSVSGRTAKDCAVLRGKTNLAEIV